jgi:hypothetical protein
MPVMPRMITRFTRHADGSALRLDYYQILTPEVGKVATSTRRRAFRLSEYIAPIGGPLPRAACPCSARAIRMISITPRCLVTGRTTDRTPSGSTDRLQLAEAAFSSVMFRRPPG